MYLFYSHESILILLVSRSTSKLTVCFIPSVGIRSIRATVAHKISQLWGFISIYWDVRSITSIGSVNKLSRSGEFPHELAGVYLGE